jgi:hypothetical protein
MMSFTPSSKTPYVEGYVTISAARLALCSSAFAKRSALSTLPSASEATTTTRIPAITAEAGLVPCADTGMRHTLRWPSPRACRYARMAISPAYSPAAPLLGCTDTAAKPVIVASHVLSESIISR